MMEFFMVPLLVLICIFSIMGTLHNKKTRNIPGLIIGGCFTLGIVLVTMIALYDLIIGIG